MTTAQEAAARIDAIAVPIGLARIARMGEAESGASRFYGVRLERGTLFSSYDIALADALAALPDAPRVVHEIGGGLGNLSMLLAAMGFEVVCLEMSGHRHGGAREILDAVQAAMPEVRSCRLKRVAFPDKDLSPRGAMVVATNLVATTSDEARTAIIEGLKTYSRSIIDVDRFLTMAETPEARQARLDDLAARGLTGDLFLDTPGGCFYALRPAITAPPQREGLGGMLRRWLGP